MGFEPTSLRDLAGRSNHWGTGDPTISKGEILMSLLHLKGHCHEDFAVLSQFCAKIVTLLKALIMNKKLL